MNRQTLSILVFRANLALSRVNLVWAAVALVWLLAFVMWLWMAPLWQQQLASLRVQSTQAERVQESPAQPVWKATAPQSDQNLDAFMANLGEQRHAEQQLKALFAIAQDLGLELTQGQYRMSCDEGSRFCKYRVQLPVKGPYDKVRVFSEQVLQAIPFASIDELNLRRESIADTDVDAKIGMTLYLRKMTQSPAAGKGRNS
jgi:hypothetical protein